MKLSKVAIFCAANGYSMMPAEWLDQLHTLAHAARNTPGDIVECGVYNGGSAFVLAHGAYTPWRRVWLFDSWSGLPKPTKPDGVRAAARYAETGGKMDVGDLDVARNLFDYFPEVSANFMRGRFSTTLKRYAGDIAILHIDADWYNSVKLCLEVLLPHVVEGGLVIIHDYYAWPGTFAACNEVLTEDFCRSLPVVAKSGIYFYKHWE